MTVAVSPSREDFHALAETACPFGVAHVADERFDARFGFGVERFDIERADCVTGPHELPCQMVPEKSTAAGDRPGRHGLSAVLRLREDFAVDEHD